MYIYIYIYIYNYIRRRTSEKGREAWRPFRGRLAGGRDCSSLGARVVQNRIKHAPRI